jgi:molecular chaperone Hsp33
MEDYILRATAANGQIRAFAAKTNKTVETARGFHNTTPVVTAALGRTLTGAAIMGAMLKDDQDILTVSIKGDGPVGGIVVTADSKSNVKGYAYEPYVILPLKSNGKLDVGRAVGKGTLNVVKDMGLKEPVTGSIELISGEIAEDFTRYFAVSEQTPSMVALGVLVDVDLSVKQAGGLCVQLMPGAADDVIDALERRIIEMDTITNYMEKGMGPEEILTEVLGVFNPVVLEKSPVNFLCSCSRKKAENALRLMGKDELTDILSKEKTANIHCHFCNKSYDFFEDELTRIRDGI